MWMRTRPKQRIEQSTRFVTSSLHRRRHACYSAKCCCPKICEHDTTKQRKPETRHPNPKPKRDASRKQHLIQEGAHVALPNRLAVHEGLEDLQEDWDQNNDSIKESETKNNAFSKAQKPGASAALAISKKKSGTNTGSRNLFTSLAQTRKILAYVLWLSNQTSRNEMPR